MMYDLVNTAPEVCEFFNIPDLVHILLQPPKNVGVSIALYNIL